MRLNSAALILTAALVVSCTNGKGPPKRSTSSAQSTQGNGQVAKVKATYKISSIEVQAPTGTGGTVSAVTVRLDNTPPFTDVTTFCSADSGPKACVCYFKWSEVNPNSVYTVTIPRYVETPLTLIQPSLALCNSPENWDLEVKDGTMIQIGLKPAAGLSEFAMPAYNYVKNPNTTGGDFRDAQGHAFDNILHYSCFEQFFKGTLITSRLGTIQVNNGNGQPQGTITAAFANDFCLVNVENGTALPAGCNSVANSIDYSAESNYYNLYTRAADRGTINGSGNGRYTCPRVEEPLSGNNQASFWPLDATFALATSPNGDFAVAVEGFSKISFGSDPKSQSTTCYSRGAPPTGPPGDTILTGCLGFASKPKVDGTCNTFKDANNNTKPQFRLRRYIAVYPPSFEADGQPFKQGQATDVIYVLDRPVTNPADPNKPFSMLGPKPCPFSYFDHKRAVAANPNYVGTSDAGWNGRNYDGLQFPNRDDAQSCSALVAIPNANKTRVSFGTVNVNNPINRPAPVFNSLLALNQVWIRPTQPWAPHYEEDTAFKACAPQSTPVKDPPLHFSKDATTGQISYCAEVYPSQNGNAERLDLVAGTPGAVVNFTSHRAKNSTSNPCTGRKPAGVSAAYTAGPALHNNGTDLSGLGIGLDGPATTTCDRTIPASTDAFFRVPLTQSAGQVETSIAADPSYRCTITWDNGGAKKGRLTPSGGCCGASVTMNTGVGGNLNAHLEPTGDGSTPTTCAVPAY